VVGAVGGKKECDVAMRSHCNKQAKQCADVPAAECRVKISKTRVLGVYCTDLHDFGTVRTGLISRVRILTRLATELFIFHFFTYFEA
jgi:hypothetical protein